MRRPIVVATAAFFGFQPVRNLFIYATSCGIVRTNGDIAWEFKACKIQREPRYKTHAKKIQRALER
jgi:hypothetical protein